MHSVPALPKSAATYAGPPPNKALELTGRHSVGLRGSPAGRPPRFGVDPPGGRRMGPGTLTGGRQLNARSVRRRGGARGGSRGRRC